MDPKAINAWLVPPLRFLRYQGRVDLEEDVVEGGAEVGAVDAVVARGLGVVDVLALGAVEFDIAGVGDVVLAHGEQVLGFAEDARAFAEGALLVFLDLDVKISMGQVILRDVVNVPSLPVRG
jgi:hypothetical protein